MAILSPTTMWSAEVTGSFIPVVQNATVSVEPGNRNKMFIRNLRSYITTNQCTVHCVWFSYYSFRCPNMNMNVRQMETSLIRYRPS